jgi:two-component system, cell cycle response regulator DivK
MAGVGLFPSGDGGGALMARRPKILVVDDYPDALDMLVQMLSLSGFEAIAATNGQEAVEQAAAHAPDAIVMDVFMPVMDGIEAARRIKADPRLAHIPIIACTARAAPLDSDLFTITTVKPVPPDRMLAALAAVLPPALT